MDATPRPIAPRPGPRGGDNSYYRNVRIGVHEGQFTVVDAAGTPHGLAADALAWVDTRTARPRLLVLDSGGVVIAELPSEGWDVDELADFGDAVGVPLVEEFFPDELTARAAYPLPSKALRVHAKEVRAVLLQFLPVLVPVVVVIILVLILS